MSNRSEKGRALFLAALMVVSVFAMGVAFAGTAAAADGSVTADTDFVAIGSSASFSISDTDSPGSATVAFTSDTEGVVTGVTETKSGTGSKTIFTVSTTPIADTDGDGTIAGDEVTATADGSSATVDSVNPKTGEVTLSSAPSDSTDNVEITYDHYPEANEAVDVGGESGTTTISVTSDDTTLETSDGDEVTAYYWDADPGVYRTASMTADGDDAITVSEGESIQDAVNTVGTDGTVYVSGTHTLSSDIDVNTEGVTITNAENADPVIQNNDLSRSETAYQGLIAVRASGVTIENIEFDTNNDAAAFDGGETKSQTPNEIVIRSSGDKLTVSNINVDREVASGEPSIDGAQGVSSDKEITIEESTLSGGEIGLGDSIGDGTTITGNDISNVYGEGIWGIPAEGASLTITGNSITNYDIDDSGETAIKLNGDPGTVNGQIALSPQIASLLDNNEAHDVAIPAGTQYEFAVNVTQDRISVDETTTLNADVAGVNASENPSFSYEVINNSVVAGTAPTEAVDLTSTPDSTWTANNFPIALGTYDDSDSGVWDPANDALWFESGDNPGYQSSEDTLVAGTEPSQGAGSDGFNTADWTLSAITFDTVQFYESGDQDDWNSGQDAILVESETITSGVFSGDSLSVDVTPGVAGNYYEVRLLGGSNAGLGATVSDAVVSDYTVDNLATDPADPVYGDDPVLVSGTLTAGDAGVSNMDLDLVMPDDDTLTTSTGSDGSFTFAGFGPADAGTYEVAASANHDRVFAEFTVSPEQADVSFTADGENTAGFEQTYNVTVLDSEGDAIDFSSGDINGYVNVTGQFSDVPADQNVSNKLSQDGDVVAFHLDPSVAKNSNSAEFDATPLEGDNLTATLENGVNSDTYAGLEDTSDVGDSAASPDIVGSDDLPVTVSDANLTVTVEQDELAAATDQPVDVNVYGVDGNYPDGPDGDALDNATVTLSGPGVDQSASELNGTTDTGDADDNGNPVAFTQVNPDEAGTLTVSVTAYENDGTEFTVEKTLNITGDKIVDISPTSANIDDTENVSVQVSDAGDEAVYNRIITIGQSDGSSPTLTVYDEADDTLYEGVTALELDGSNGEVSLPNDGDTVINADFSPTAQGEYIAENVTFSATGDFDVNVERPGPTSTAKSLDAISVTGIEAYDVASNRTAALAGADEVHNLTITNETGAVVNGTDLDSFTVDVSHDGSTNTIASPTIVDADGDGTNDRLQIGVLATNASDPVNITVHDGESRTGELSLDVVEPQISTTLGGDALTLGLKPTVENSSFSRQALGFALPALSTEALDTFDRVYSYTLINTEGVR